MRVRTGIGERTLALPHKGNGIISWGAGRGRHLLIPALDLADPSMLTPIGERVGPVELLPSALWESFPATDLQWGSQTVPDPALYDPIGTPEAPASDAIERARWVAARVLESELACRLDR